MAHYETDPPHTFVTFAVQHFATSTVCGRFDQVGGFVELDRAAGQGYAEIVIDMKSINSGTPAFDEHLRSPAFFDVANFPRATFIGRDFRFVRGVLQSVDGELTLLGQSHPVTLRSTCFNCYDSPLHKAEVCGGDFETTIPRSVWGMTWGLDLGVPDEVRLSIQIEAVRK
ncbi:MAG: YceI family protein [Gammaproteobacteria bacterium]